MVESGAGLRVLLVEDDDAVRDLTAELIWELGHQVLPAPNAELALANLASLSFDVVMTDIRLPGKSGLVLAREVSERFPELSIIISSGYQGFTKEVLERELQLRVSVVPKPYEFETLRRALESVSALRKTQSGNFDEPHPRPTSSL